MERKVCAADGGGRGRGERAEREGSGAIHTFLLKILRFGIYFLITYVYIQSRRFIREAYMRLRAAGERTAAGGVSAMAGGMSAMAGGMNTLADGVSAAAGMMNAAAGERAAVRPAGNGAATVRGATGNEEPAKVENVWSEGSAGGAR